MEDLAAVAKIKGAKAAPWGLVLLLVGLAVLRVAIVWNELPERVASHFGGGGEPDGWMARDAFFSVLGFLFALVLGALAALPWLLRRLPTGLINLPNRDYWMAPERKAATLSTLSTLVAWLALPVAVLLVGILESTVRANLHGTGIGMAAGWLFAGFVAYMMVWLVVLVRRFHKPSP